MKFYTEAGCFISGGSSIIQQRKDNLLRLFINEVSCNGAEIRSMSSKDILLFRD